MSEPLAYFLTWTCYGTWAPGDERGSVDARHRQPGGDFALPDVRVRAYATQTQRDSSVRLDVRAREIVHDTIFATAMHREWEIVALSVRSNHVHVVVAAGDIPPERVMASFKAWATRRLRERGVVTPDQHVWTKHGSTRYLWKREHVHKAARYVTDYQGD